MPHKACNVFVCLVNFFISYVCHDDDDVVSLRHRNPQKHNNNNAPHTYITFRLVVQIIGHLVDWLAGCVLRSATAPRDWVVLDYTENGVVANTWGHLVEADFAAAMQ